MSMAVSMKSEMAPLCEWHQRMVDFILENPEASIADLALHFNKSPNWIRLVTDSDAFQAQLKERAAEAHANDMLQLTPEDQASGVLQLALAKLEARIAVPGSNMDTGDLLTAVKTLNDVRKPKTGETPGGMNVNFNFGVDSDLLQGARERIRERQETRVIEAAVEDTSDSSSAGGGGGSRSLSSPPVLGG